MGRLLAGLIGIVGALWLGIAGAAGMWWWDRQPERPAWTQAHFLFLAWPHWLRDPSLAARNTITLAALSQCHANEQTMQVAIDEQNGSIQALSAKGAAAVSREEAAIKQAQTTQASALRLQRSIASLPPVTKADDCPALDLSDQLFVGYLRSSR